MFVYIYIFAHLAPFAAEKKKLIFSEGRQLYVTTTMHPPTANCRSESANRKKT